MKKYTNWLGQIKTFKLFKSLEVFPLRKPVKDTCALFTLGLWLLIVPVTPISAQDLQVNLAVPTQVVDNFAVCGEAKSISLTIENIVTDTLTDVTVSLPLLTGFS